MGAGKPNQQFTASSVLADRALLRVGLRFVAFYVGLMAIVVAVSYAGGWSGLCLATASASRALIVFTGVNATQVGTSIQLVNRTLQIDAACTSVFVVAVFCALVLAYPVRLSMRLLGVAIGVPVILAFNLARIVAAAQVAVNAPSSFGFFHDYLFEVGMVLVALAVWAAWLSFTRQHAG